MNKLLRTSLLAVLMAGTSAHAMAQTADERIAALEAKIAALTGELSDLKTETKKANQDINKKLGATASLPNGRPTITSADGANKFAVRAVAQFDAAAYDRRNNVPGGNDFNTGTNFRRARLGVEGTVAKHWNYNLTGEFGGSGGESAQLNQAFVEYTGWKPLGPDIAVRLRIGAWATPAGLEDATSFSEALFMERASVVEIVRGLAGGDGRTGVGAFANGERWYASAAFTGAVVGTPAVLEFDEQTGFMTRVAFSPVGGEDYALHLGANIQGVLEPTDIGPGTAKVTQLRLRDRPEIRVDGVRLVDTGNISADGATSYGLELGGFYKNFQISAEAMRIDVNRTTGFNPRFDGYYVQGVWTLTGEHRTWSSANGGFKGFKPAKPFSPADGTWGALEIAARYSVLDLNDNAGAAGAVTPAGGVRGGEQSIATLGVNWYPNAVYRFQAQYQHIDIDRLNAAGLQIGEDVDVVSFRSQFAF